ncbi:MULTISPECIES: discoidin domain-containing protein [Acinetobacter]|jgi:hypothetical protein|uniref:discoidin domain-containing protein n=1 Tax=Acinetobacter TaxID=469 RepID=UPI00049F7F5C|nr:MULTISPECIES: discoidin domain-containing protein [Acinetobacter]KCX37130.1 F5/8 type C domain protein [Acinetobacter sp. 263903-1]MCM1935871.1 discoidin domain-containing protein [Acinetobacter radioresistens]MCM1953736.1 discoidin domain-containing protein [Acinetobacter radioresistens]MCU4310206.1 discoidin domain-containing protein [Acinetobacter radioresistens]MCU4568560.1 discoidin domain-containing protein [Acinetobacter radioresistens]
MAGIRLEFAQFGDFDSFDIFRSNTPINISSLPNAIATGLTTMYYIDTAIIEGATYYYMVRVNRDGANLLSEQIKVKASPFLPFRYMRVYITANNGLDSYSEFQQIEFALQSGGVDITTASTPSYQSSYYPDRPASNLVSNAFDGANYIWTSAIGVSGPHWVAFDLLSPQDVVEVRIYPTNLHPWQGRAPKDFIIQGSEDNLTWVDIKGFYGVSGWVPGIGKVFSLK